MTVKKEIIDILACPACGHNVQLENGRVICLSCGRKYPVKNGIPVMLVEEAEGPLPGKD